MKHRRISDVSHSIKSVFVIRSTKKNVLFAGGYVCTFQPGNFTGRGSERFERERERERERSLVASSHDDFIIKFLPL